MNYDHTRFLIVRLSSIGDVVNATPVAHALKKAWPSCHITWLASPPCNELLRYNSDIDELLIWNRQVFDKAVSGLHLRAARASLQEAKKLFAYAKENSFAIPAVNVVGTDSVNAVLEVAAKVNSPIIIQFSNGGAGFSNTP